MAHFMPISTCSTRGGSRLRDSPTRCNGRCRSRRSSRVSGEADPRAFYAAPLPFYRRKSRDINQGGIGRRNDEGQKLESGDEGDVWVKLQFRLNGINADDVWNGYQENLVLVLDEIENLLPDIDGKTVLSTDHGNLVGDWIGPIPCRGYGHPPDLYVNDLIKIPWFIISGNRRNITVEAPVREDTIDDEVVADRLVNLGYQE